MKRLQKLLFMMLVCCFALALNVDCVKAEETSKTDADNYVFDLSDGSINLQSTSSDGAAYQVTCGSTSVDVPAGQNITITQSNNGTATSNYIYVNSSVTADVYMTLDGVNIDSNDMALYCMGSGTLYIELESTNTLKISGDVYAGLYVETGDVVINDVDQDGKLEAHGGKNAAGIGGRFKTQAENITINGGTISAYGGENGAGIGGGYGAWVENITINGGTISAYGGENGAGIGGGDDGCVKSITINGGTISAYGKSGAAGIGSGRAGNTLGAATATITEIRITGGKITAVGGNGGNGGTTTSYPKYGAGAGIGGGGDYDNSDGGMCLYDSKTVTNVSISGNAEVTATPGTVGDIAADAIGAGGVYALFDNYVEKGSTPVIDFTGFTGTLTYGETAISVPVLVTTELPDGDVSAKYEYALQSKGAEAVYSLVEETTLPEGLAMADNGVISGTPATAGTYTFKIKTADKTGTFGYAINEFSILVYEAADAAANQISGITAGSEYFQGSAVKFKALGAGIADTYTAGDVRYLPVAWEVGDKKGDFANGYEVSLSTEGMAAGSHTLKVTYLYQKYDGENWINTETNDTKSVTFTVKSIETGDNGNNTGTGDNGNDTGTEDSVNETNVPQKGETVTDTAGKANYQVTKAGNTSDSTGTVAYVSPVKKTATVKIPATIKVDGITYKVTSIAKNAFKNNKKVTKVEIGSNVKTIGADAFHGCTKLTTVTIGKNVTTIGSNAFNGCKKLKTVNMGSKVTTIGDKAFYKCTALTKITIPSKVKKIGKQAFYGCKKLKTITIKTTKLTSKNVGSKAFKGINSKAKIKVPKSKVKAYKSLLKKKGIGKNVTVKK